MEPSLDIVDELVGRIVDSVAPLQIVLFGSAARDEWTPDKDLDILIVVPRGAHRRRVAQAVYRHLLGFDYAVDVVVVTEEDLQEYGDNDSLVIRPAILEGREIYAA